MALLSFRGISTPSLMAQGEQRRSSIFNIRRGNPTAHGEGDKLAPTSANGEGGKAEEVILWPNRMKS
jgi:hypothetical protein